MDVMRSVPAPAAGGSGRSAASTSAASGDRPLEVAVVATTPALVCVVDRDGRIALFNPALEAATGWSAHEVVGRYFWDVLVVPHEVEPAQDCIRRALAHGEVAHQEGDWLDRWGGFRRVAIELSVTRGPDGRPTAVVCVGFDVTEQRRLEAQLRVRARTDVLTGLANREALNDALDAELADGPGCGLLFCDLDGFKIANDTHGHEVGDLLLQQAARRLLDATGPDDVVARFGGDEFVVLCRTADGHRVARTRRRIDRAFAAPFVTAQGLVEVGISVGTALGAPGGTREQLLATADRHMYGVKTCRRRGGTASGRMLPGGPAHDLATAAGHP